MRIQSIIVALLAMCSLAYPQDKMAADARVIFLTQTGFEPSDITTKAGPVWLLIRSKVPGNPTFELTAASQKADQALLANKNRKIARDVVTLAAGEYVLTDGRNPKWTCRIHVR